MPRIAELRPDGWGYQLDPARPGEVTRLAVPWRDDRRWGEADFTPTGAALYRAISGVWSGPDWEEDLQVSNGYYREDHRYCDSEEGFEGVVSELMAEGQVVRATRVVPIGPWCVHWWKRFPAGFRMELEVGDRPVSLAR